MSRLLNLPTAVARCLPILLLAVVAGCGAEPHGPTAALQKQGALFTFNEAGEPTAAYLYERNWSGELTDEAVAPVAEFPTLRLLLIESSHVTDDVVKPLGKLKELEDLDLTLCRGVKVPSKSTVGGITDDALPQLAALPIKRLGLNATRTTEIAVARLQRRRPELKIRYNYGDRLMHSLQDHDGDLLPALQSAGNVKLNAEGRPVDVELFATDAALPYLAEFPEIERLLLLGRYTTVGLEELKPLSNLRVLEIPDTNHVSMIENEFTDVVAGFTHLTELNLNFNGLLTAEALEPLGRLPDLKLLKVIDCGIPETELRKFKLAHPDCTIEVSTDPLVNASLNLKGDLPDHVRATATNVESDDSGTIVGVEYKLSHIGNDGLRKLAYLTGLQSLTLKYCRRFTDEGLTPLVNLPNLEHLTLAGTEITDTGLDYVSKFKQLKSLDLEGDRKISDAGINRLEALSTLTSLNLRNTPVSGISAGTLGACKQLKHLDLRGTQFEQAGVDGLKRRLPGCEILF